MAASKMGLKDIIKYECIYIFRQNPKLALILLGLPILYSLLFGLVYNGNIVKNMPTLIYDQDQSTASFALIRSFADSERYNIVAQVTSQEAMEENLQRGDAVLAVVIPPNFAHDIKLGKSSQVLITINSANIMFSNAILGSVQEIVQTISVGAGQNSLEGLSQLPSQALSGAAPIRLGVRVLHNPTFSYSNFMLAGLAANGLQIAIMISICGILAREFSNLSPWKSTSPLTLIIGKILPYWLCAMVSFITALCITITLFQVPFRGDIGSLLLIGCAFTFAITTVGLFYSVIAPNVVYAVQLPMLYIMPSYLFSGYSWPTLAMNDFSRGFSAILPITYAADSIRDILLAGYSPSLLTNILILLTFSTIFLSLSILIFSLRRKKILKSLDLEASL